jgi:hypothetical protein
VAQLHEESQRHDRGAVNRPRRTEAEGHAKAAGESEREAQAAPSPLAVLCSQF